MLMEASRLGEFIDERNMDNDEQVVIEERVTVANEEFKVANEGVEAVGDRRRLLVAPRFKRNMA